MNKIKQYLFNKVRDIILYFLNQNFDGIRNNIIQLNKLHNANSKHISDILYSIIIIQKDINKLSKDSVTMGLDISSCKEDSTSIIILSRIKGKERIEFIEKRFNNIGEVESFIKSIKKDNDNVYIDKPHNYLPINF